MTKIILRDSYLSVLKEYEGTPQIKVLTGVRRCGKSTLLEIMHDNMLSSGIPSQNVLLLKCDSAEIPLNPTQEWLDDLVGEVIKDSDPAYKVRFFFDEIQEIPGWERVIRRLHTSKNADIYITGSNAHILSSDLATHLSGRYVEIPVYPLSFTEYREFSRQLRSDKDSKDALFGEYVRYGGMPGLFELENPSQEAIVRELQAIRDTVILNDVAKRFRVRDIALLDKLVRYLFSTSGNLFSTRNIVNALKSGGRKVYDDTIDSYLSFLKKAYLVYPCSQEGVQGKEILRPLNKYFAPDTGLRNLEIGFALQDMGFQLESVVRMEFARRGYSVSIGRINDLEIDFVATKNDEKVYIQVAQLIDDEVLVRESRPLQLIKDSFEKMILTQGRTNLGTTRDGIKVRNVIDWLLEVEK